MTKNNLYIDSEIFNEIETTANLEDFAAFEYGADLNDIFRQVLALDNPRSEFDSDEEQEDAIDVSLDGHDGYLFRHLSRYSFLYHALMTIDPDFRSHVRSLVEDGDDLYFVTGMGYDIIDVDLLGGDGSGRARAHWLDQLNKIVGQ